MKTGKLIVIEGTDASGKSTQLKLLFKRLNELGKESIMMHFPKHNESFGKVVDAYLRGEFGSKESLPPEFIAMLYMTDFFESKKKMEEILSSGKNILLSRFFSSTLTYQVALAKPEEKEALWLWIKNVCMRLPQPDLVLVLSVPPSFSRKLSNNPGRIDSYKLGRKKDLHEADYSFQENVFFEYERNISKLGWKKINCVENNSLLPIEAISEKIWGEVEKVLEK